MFTIFPIPKMKSICTEILKALRITGLLILTILFLFFSWPEKANAQELVLEFGEFGNGQGELNVPFGIDVDGEGTIFVADRSRNRILKFASNGEFIDESAFFFDIDVDLNPPLSFDQVSDIAIDNEGRVYAANEDDAEIVVLDSDFNPLFNFGGGCVGPSIPGEGCSDPDGGGPLEIGDGQFNQVGGITFDSVGRIIALDQSLNSPSSNRVQIFDLEGNFLLKFGTGGTGNSQFQIPSGVDVDTSGNIYVADTGNDRIQVFDSNGNFLLAFGSECSLEFNTGCVDPDGAGPLELGDGQFSSPIDVAVDLSGNIYVADSSNGRVQIFDALGNFIQKFDVSEDSSIGVNGIAVDDLGIIYVTRSTAGGSASSSRVRVYETEDTDEDGLLDLWEQSGVNNVDLPAIGANPLRKDLFLEIDCLVSDGNGDGDIVDTTDHSHCPLMGAVEDVVQAFANAPITNLDGTTGIQLHIDTGSLYGVDNVISVNGTGGVVGNYGDLGGGGDQIPEAGNTIIDWDGAVGDPATDFYTLKQANFAPERQPIFRYSLFGNQTNLRRPANDCTSGWAEGIPGNDFMVTLGGSGVISSSCWGTDANGFSVGSREQQAGTLMHELGHVIGLNHRGGDGVNNKPNYLSVMSYAFQFCSVPMQPGVLPGQCDYSQDAINLNEPSLDECLGFDNGLYGFGTADWDGDSDIEGVTNCQPPNNANVSADINGDGDITALNGYDDWDNIQYKFRDLANAANGVSSPVPDESDPEIIDQSRQILSERLRPELQLEKIGPEKAIIGETLTYTLRVSNVGRGPALNVVLDDIFPDGSSETFGLSTLVVGAEEVRVVDFTVPLETQNDTMLTNTARVTYEDVVGNQFTNKESFTTHIIPKFEYVAKVICGLQDSTKELRLTPGAYATAINVHNPNYSDVPFFKKLALAFPRQAESSLGIFPIATDVLTPDEAATLDCVDIKDTVFQGEFPSSYVEGFIVIQSRSSLDVEAVYTTADSRLKHSSIDVERVPEREIDLPEGQPDLIVTDIASIDVDCPQGDGSCVTTARVTVANVGESDATAFNTQITFDPSQSLMVNQAFSEGLAAGASETFSVTGPAGRNCFDPDCTICVVVDSEDDVPESNEENNERCETRGG